MFNPSGSKFTTDVTINSVIYTVTAFNDNGASPIIINYQKSNGAYKGFTGKAGVHNATMTIECASSTEAAPAQWASLTYPTTASAWIITQVGEARSGTAAATYNLSLQNPSGSVA